MIHNSFIWSALNSFQFILLNQMNIYILVISLIFVDCQLPEQPPPKFALLTVTHTRNNTYDIFLNYLKHYTETQCYEKLISEICIIWNNKQSPDQVGALDRQLFWRVPVYFYQTKNNSLNHRFKTPRQATAEVFYSLDDDIMIDCDTLNQTYLHFWKSKQYNPRRFVSNQVRSFGYMLNRNTQFYYQGHSYAQYFTIAETGATFFPKHYLNLYYLDLEELEKLRRKVDNITSCQDIFFMAISQHFYPEMAPEYYHPLKAYVNTNPSVGLSRLKGLVSLRTSCINFLTDTFGYNPLRFYSKNPEKYANNWQFKNIEVIMQAKTRGLVNVALIQELQNDQTDNQFTNLDSTVKPSESKSQKTSNKMEYQQPQQLKQQTNQILTQQGNQKILDIQPQKQARTEKNILESHRQSQNKQHQSQSFLIKYKFQILMVFLLTVILALVICVIRLLRMYNELKNNNHALSHAVEQEESPIHIAQF